MKRIVTSQYEEAVQKLKTLPAPIKRNANKLLSEMGKQYWPEIPMDDIVNGLRALQIELVNEDGTPFSAIFTGDEGRANIDLKWMDAYVTNSELLITWYKMPSGNYEIVAYLG